MRERSEKSRWKRYPKYKDSGVEWLGEIPEEWGEKRLKYLSKEPLKYGANESAEDEDTNSPRFIRITDINPEGSLREDTFKSLPEDIARDFRLIDGDILFARSGATVGKTFIYSPSWGRCCYAGYLVRLRSDKGQVIPRFIYHYSSSIPYWDWISSINIQSTIQNVSGDKYANHIISLPSLSEQTAIVSFLDRETARIDTLIGKKKRQIELLQEKRAALISQAVTKGLDPTVTMKDSGVPWLGEIPDHWEIITNRRFITRIEQGWSPVADDRTCDIDEWGVTKLNAVSHGTFQPKEHKALPNELTPLTNYEIKEGDLLITRSNTPALVGDTCVVETSSEKILLCDLIYRIEVDKRIIDKKYVCDYWLSGPGRYQITRDARGSSQSMVKISQEHILSWIIIRPPIEEQQKIIQKIDTEITKTKKIESMIHKSIHYLHEYRSALISAAVTGKIDIRSEYEV